MRTIATVQELDALPVGSVVLSHEYPVDNLNHQPTAAFQKRGDGNWYRGARTSWVHPDGFLPATILHAPGERGSVDPEWIKEQRRQGWPDMHPEDNCHLCGARNISWCAAERDDWLAATSAWAAETGREGICCPTCFADMYQEQTGEDPIWMLAKYQWKIDLPDRDTIAAAIASGYEPDHPAANHHDYRAADAVLQLLKENQ